MSNFKVGQKVVCIDDSKQGGINIINLVPLIKGEIYTITEFVECDYGYIGITTKEQGCMYFYNGKIAGNKIERFRPLDHAFADEVEAMIKEQVKQDELINI